MISQNSDPGRDNACCYDVGHGHYEGNCYVPHLGGADFRESRKARREKGAGQRGLQKQSGEYPHPVEQTEEDGRHSSGQKCTSQGSARANSIRGPSRQKNYTCRCNPGESYEGVSPAALQSLLSHQIQGKHGINSETCADAHAEKYHHDPERGNCEKKPKISWAGGLSEKCTTSPEADENPTDNDGGCTDHCQDSPPGKPQHNSLRQERCRDKGHDRGQFVNGYCLSPVLGDYDIGEGRNA